MCDEEEWPPIWWLLPILIIMERSSSDFDDATLMLDRDRDLTPSASSLCLKKEKVHDKACTFNG